MGLRVTGMSMSAMNTQNSTLLHFFHISVNLCASSLFLFASIGDFGPVSVEKGIFV